jgi:predicted nucleic acid-binding protein
MILVDTSVWIEFFRNANSWEAARLENALTTDEDVAICGPILMELRQGIASAKAVREVERRLAPLVYLPTQRATYCHAADLYRKARAKGQTVRNSVDCLIAACALENRVRLLQRDRDFVTIAAISSLDLVLPE